MKHIIYYCFLAVLLLVPITALAQPNSFDPLGSQITSDSSNNFFGEEVAISGNRVAVMRPGLAGNPEVQVREWDGTTWVLVGSIFTPSTTARRFYSLSLEGNRLAIGSRANSSQNLGEVRVYDWDGSTWQAVGAVLTGTGDFGCEVEVRGKSLAVGAQSYFQSGFGNRGQVVVYEWNGLQWTMKGSPILGAPGYNLFGSALDFDGQRLVVGSYYETNMGSPQEGAARVYEWTGTAWQQMGATLRGEHDHDSFGHSVSLSGNRLAVGALAYLNFGQPIDSLGYTKVYEWDGTTWQQMGNKIVGVAMADGFGGSVALDGSYLVAGAFKGAYIKGYQWNGMDWIVDAMESDVPNSFYGTDIAIDNSRLIVGASRYANSGYAQVYTFCADYFNEPVTQTTNTLSADSSANSYQWLRCTGTSNSTYTVISGATMSSFTPSTNGDYALRVMRGNCTNTSPCFDVTLLNIRQLDDGLSYEIYPNPTSNQFTLSLERACEQVVVQLYTTNGVMLQQQLYNDWQGGNLSLRKYPTGLYLLSIQVDGQAPSYIKLQKQ